jgi:hypothetical protein
VSQKRHRRFFGNKVQARLKRRGKSSPLAKQFARQEKPHAVQDKTEEGQPARRSSGIVASRRIKIRRAPSPSFAGEDVDLGASPAKLELGEINDRRGLSNQADRIRLTAIKT